jgi:hypothetical protein
MTSNIFKMCDRDTIKFIELYESEPILWDRTLKNYKSRECRGAAAKRIARTMGIDGFTEVQWRARNFAHIGYFTNIILLK